MENSLRSKHKVSLLCCQAIGREVRIVHHRESLDQQRLLVNCPRAVGAEELRQIIQSSFEYW